MTRSATNLSILVSALVLACAAACTKSETDTSATTSTPSATASASAPASATAAAAASASAASTTIAAADPSAKATAKDAADAGRAVVDANGNGKKDADAGAASAAAPSGSAVAAQCGTKPLPDCPLQAWMKANANPPVLRNDLPGIATALDKVAGFAPAGYTNWASIAKDGATAAKGGDITAAKAACRSCHDQYKTKYKTEMRARKI